MHRYHGRLLERVAYHPVVAAVHRAFMDHHPLCLSPDMIWLMIIQGVANHINAHAEDLRSRIVSHHSKLIIEVRRDDFVKGSPRILGRKSSANSRCRSGIMSDLRSTSSCQAFPPRVQ